MSRRVVIDSLAFGRAGGLLEGELEVAVLARLHDLLVDQTGTLVYRIEGGVGPSNRAQLLLRVDGDLSLCCQRCLEALRYPLKLSSLLEIIDSDVDLTQEELEDDSRDFLVAEQELDVQAMIEDEILLALPAVPRHDGCVLPGNGRDPVELSSFSVLAGLHGRSE